MLTNKIQLNFMPTMKKTVLLIVTFTPFSKLFIESGCSGANKITQTQLKNVWTHWNWFKHTNQSFI